MKDIYSFRRSTMAKIQSKTDVQLKKESEDLYATRKAREDALVTAYNDKKLKSKKLISQAKAIIARREEKKVDNSENF